MKIYFSFLFFFCMLTSTAQVLDEFEIAKQDNGWLEQELDKGQIINSKRKVLKAEYDEKNKVLYLITYRGKKDNPKIFGGLSALNLKNGKTLWSRPFHTKDDGFILLDTIPVVFAGSSSWALNWKTEEKIWRVKCQLVSSTSDNSIAIGLAPDYEEQYKLVGVDAHSGNELWSRKLKRDHQIRSIKFLNDTAWVSNFKGLDYTDVRNGKGFFHKTKLFEEEKLGRKQAAGVLVGAFFLGIIGGALGYIAVPIPLEAAANTLQTQTSLAISDGYFYRIDAKNVIKLNLNGEVIWETEFASDWREPDKIFVRSNKVFVIKDGYELHPSEYRPEGVAGIQQYHTASGALVGQLTSDEPIEDYITKDSTIVLALTSKVQELTLSDFSVIKETLFANGEQLTFGFDKILNPPLYVQTDEQLLNSEKHFKGHIYVQDKDGNKFEFDENFDLIRRMNPAHVYEISQVLSEDQFIITNGLRNFWVKANGEKVLPFSFSRNLKVMKKSVLDVDENKVLVYPVDRKYN